MESQSPNLIHQFPLAKIIHVKKTAVLNTHL